MKRPKINEAEVEDGLASKTFLGYFLGGNLALPIGKETHDLEVVSWNPSTEYQMDLTHYFRAQFYCLK